MKRAVYVSAVIVIVAALMTASAYSQTQRSQVRASRRGGPYSGRQATGGQTSGGGTMPSGGMSGSMSGGGGGGSSMMGGGMGGGFGGMAAMDPNMTPQQRMEQQQQQFQQQMAQMQQQAAQMQRLAEESRYNSIRQMLNATDAQWPQVKTKLDLIERLKAEAGVAAEPGSGTMGSGGFGGGMTGWSSGGMMMGASSSSGQPQTWSQNWGTPSSQGTSANPSDGEALCRQLLRDLQTPGTPQTDIAQRVAALRKIRSQAQEQLARARQDLRALITPAQEPALVTLGYLD